jgi:hypothetical protein
MNCSPDLFPGQVDVLEFTLEHVTAIASPARSEVFWAFNAQEPRSAVDVAKHLRKPASSVHYHVNELVRVALLIQVGERRRKARIERLYVHAGRNVIGRGHPMTDEYRYQAARGFAAILRIFARERAVLHRVLPIRPDLGPFCYFQFLHFRLKPDVAQQLKREILALLAKYQALEDPEGVRVRITAISHPDMGELRSAYHDATGQDLRYEKVTDELEQGPESSDH